MAKKSKSCPEFIQKMDWPIFISILFLVSFLGSLTYLHYFTQQQQLRWQQLQNLQAAELAQITNLEITEELLKKADLNGDGQIDQADVEIMKEAFLGIDSDSLQADLNQDGRVDTKDYAILVQIISSRNDSQETDDLEIEDQEINLHETDNQEKEQ